MWRIRRKAKRMYNNMIKLTVVISVLIVAITLVNRNSEMIPNNLPFLRGLTVDWDIMFSRWSSKVTGVMQWAVLILILITVALITGKIVAYYQKLQRVKRSDIHSVDQMTGDQFEDFLVFFFRLLGYSAKKTKKSRDQGADVILVVNGERVVVQAKREKNKISKSAVQQVVASKAIYGATEAWVVTNSFFTEPAKVLARANNVQLWDRNRLMSELSRINIKNKKR